MAGSLRLSYMRHQLEEIHLVIYATPSLKEFHLQLSSFNILAFVGEKNLDTSPFRAVARCVPGGL